MIDRFYICGCLTLLITSLPTSLENGAGVKGLAPAMILIGLGIGCVKATISPFIGAQVLYKRNVELSNNLAADQYIHMAPQVVVTKKGERVIADRTLTLQYIYNVYYW